MSKTCSVVNKIPISTTYPFFPPTFTPSSCLSFILFQGEIKAEDVIVFENLKLPKTSDLTVTKDVILKTPSTNVK